MSKFVTGLVQFTIKEIVKVAVQQGLLNKRKVAKYMYKVRQEAERELNFKDKKKRLLAAGKTKNKTTEENNEQ